MRRYTVYCNSVYYLHVVCINTTCKQCIHVYTVLGTMQLLFRIHPLQYEIFFLIFQGLLVCEDPLCGFETNFLNPIFEGPYPRCTKCEKSQMRLEVSFHHPLPIFAEHSEALLVILRSRLQLKVQIDSYRYFYLQFWRDF